MSISEIARVMGISRNTVKAALDSDGPPSSGYVRPGISTRTSPHPRAAECRSNIRDYMSVSRITTLGVT